MSKKEETATVQQAENEQPSSPIHLPDTAGKTGNELESIRDILFGNQARATETRLSELETRIEAIRQDFQEAVDNLTADLQKQLLDTKKELQDGLNRLHTNLSERLLTMQTESQQRDNDLRQELLTMVAWLDDKKATRIDLGQMLIEVGQQLQSNGDAAETETESA